MPVLLNGEFDRGINFAGNLPLPLSQGFRLGPQDGQEALDTLGKVEDFRVYNRVLLPSEIRRLYGSGQGDFDTRSISVVYSEELELPIKVSLNFLENGFPIELRRLRPWFS